MDYYSETYKVQKQHFSFDELTRNILKLGYNTFVQSIRYELFIKETIQQKFMIDIQNCYIDNRVFSVEISARKHDVANADFETIEISQIDYEIAKKYFNSIQSSFKNQVPEQAYHTYNEQAVSFAIRIDDALEIDSYYKQVTYFNSVFVALGLETIFKEISYCTKIKKAFLYQAYSYIDNNKHIIEGTFWVELREHFEKNKSVFQSLKAYFLSLGAQSKLDEEEIKEGKIFSLSDFNLEENLYEVYFLTDTEATTSDKHSGVVDSNKLFRFFDSVFKNIDIEIDGLHPIKIDGYSPIDEMYFRKNNFDFRLETKPVATKANGHIVKCLLECEETTDKKAELVKTIELILKNFNAYVE